MADNVVVIEVRGEYTDHITQGITRTGTSVDKFTQSVRSAENEMNRLGNTSPTLKFVDKASSVIKSVMNSLSAFTGRTFRATIGIYDAITGPINGIMRQIFSLKTLAASVVIGTSGKFMVGNAIALADQLEGAQIGFESIYKNREGLSEADASLAAQKKMAEIKEFARTTPFETTGVVSSVQQMLNSGWTMENVMADMKILGDAAASVGGGTEGLSGIILALNQMRMAGKVNSQDMMQMTNRNLPAWELLADAYGVSTTEIREMVKGGKLDVNDAISGMLKQMELRYGGAMEQNSQRTVQGIMSNIKDTFDIRILERWGKGLQKGAIDGLGRFAKMLDSIDPAINAIGDSLYDLGYFLSTNFAGAVEKVARSIEMATTYYDADLGERFMREDFANAEFTEKIGILFKAGITDPLMDWYTNGGEQWLVDLGAKIGGAIAKGVASAVKGMLKDALTILPFGKETSATAPFSILGLGMVGKYFGGIAKAFGGLGKAGVSGLDELAKFTDNFSSLTKALPYAGKLFGRLGALSAVGRVGFAASSLLNLGMTNDKGQGIATLLETLGGGLAGSKLGGVIGGGIGALFAPVTSGASVAVGAAVGSVLGGFLGSTILPMVDEKLGIFSTIRDDFKALADAWPDMWKDAVDAITSLPSTIWEGLKKAFHLDGGADFDMDSYMEQVNTGLGYVTASARGGIFDSPAVSLFAEDGPEAIVPLSGGHRGEGIAMWKAAGHRLGMNTSGAGGVNVNGVTVNITVDGASASLVSTLNNNTEEIREAIAGVLRSALEQEFVNKPVLA